MNKHLTHCDFIVRGEGLDVMDFTGKSDPYIVIKVPTRVMMKRNIFEFENDISIASSSSPNSSLCDSAGSFTSSISGSSSLRNSQGTVVFHEERNNAVGEHTNMLTTLASSAVHTSAPYLYHKKAYPHTEGYKVIYETEVVKANLSPTWLPFRLGFYELCKGNAKVELLIECYDWDRFKPSDFIGSCRVSVEELLEANDEVQLQLFSKKGLKSGMLFAKCAPSSSDLAYCDFKACAADLDKKNLRGLSDPYFVIKTPVGINERRNVFSFSYDGEIVPVVGKTKVGTQSHPATDGYREIYESPVIKNTINPDWGLFQLGFHEMCRGNPETKLLFECYDYNDILKNVLIGTAEVSVQSIINTRGKIVIPLLAKKKKDAGTIYLHCRPSNASTKLRT